MGWLGPGAGVDFGDGTGRLRQDRPRKLQGIWRNWKERDHCGPSLLMMSMDDIEKKEVERIRVARWVFSGGQKVFIHAALMIWDTDIFHTDV